MFLMSAASAPRSPKSPSQLGRFKIVRRIGQGAQGEVYLAHDSRLDRNVALKTLTANRRSTTKDSAPAARSGAAGHGQDAAAQLLDEARIVSQINHPGIVAIYDADEDHGIPYLVLEYAEGETLAERLRTHGALPAQDAATIAAQLLAALGAAHAKGVMHRDVKPSNVMLSGDTVRLMDFGIARLRSGDAERGYAGTPGYVAPEYLAGTPYSEASDLFSVGAVLYEMLTGKRPLEAENQFATMQRQLTEAVPPPSADAPQVQESLDAIVLKALARVPAQRYTSAQQMRDALLGYLDPAPIAEDSDGGEPSTLQFLLRRMRHKSDFPALSSMICTVNKAASSDTDPLSSLSNSILKDFALTNKLLKLVNTAYYGQFSGSISTVSRAIVILGFEQVRQIAVTLLLFEHLQNRSQAVQLRDEMLVTYFCGLLGRELVQQAGIRDAEEAFICALFHSLGKLLAAYYLFDEYQQIARVQQAQGVDEANAAIQVLGMSFEDLGIGVAQAWHFPDRLVHSMRQVTEDKVAKPANAQERLRIVAALSNALGAALREGDAQMRRTRLAAVHTRYAALGVDQRLIETVSKAAVSELSKDAAVFGVAPGSSPLIAALTNAMRAPQKGGAESRTQELENAVGAVTLAATGESVSGVSAGDLRNGIERAAILSAGIQDITNTLVSDFQLNDVLRMILETMYRGIGFTRVLLCVRDPASNSLKGRFGFGPEIDQVLKRGFQIPLAAARNAFHAAISNGADVYIDDINGEKIRAHIPDWYRKLLPAQSLALFPVMVNKKPVALFYGDCDRPGELAFGAGELNLLKTLRNQAVLAIKSRS